MLVAILWPLKRAPHLLVATQCPLKRARALCRSVWYGSSEAYWSYLRYADTRAPTNKKWIGIDLFIRNVHSAFVTLLWYTFRVHIQDWNDWHWYYSTDLIFFSDWWDSQTVKGVGYGMYLNSSKTSDRYCISVYYRSLLVRMIACRLFVIAPLSYPMLAPF